jgi:hypothetical protein
MFFYLITLEGPGWLNELVRWIQQLIQTYHQYGAWLCKLQKGCTRPAAASDKVYQFLSHGRWFSPGTPASSTTKTGRHDIAEILLKVALNHQKSIKSNYIRIYVYSDFVFIRSKRFKSCPYTQNITL